MPLLTADAAKRCFLRDGRPFFYLADTAWCAFSHLSEEEFTRYAKKRAAQGFTVIQMSALPLSVGTAKIHPFEKCGGQYDFSKINEAYFDYAVKLCRIAIDEGLIPCIHLVWVSYMPDSWGTEMPIPEENFAPLVRFMLEKFAPVTPLFSLSGDTRFESERVVRYYKTALDIAEEIAPDALFTMHINPDCYPPEELMSHPMYGFASYQSGHGDRDWLSRIAPFSEKFLRDKPTMPLVNTEPCYEGIGHYLNKAERFSAADVRCAAMFSLLTGASAGIGYGAHGVWQCRLSDMIQFGEETWGPASDIFTALEMPGAYDMGAIRGIFENEELFGLIPKCVGDGCVTAESNGKTVTYLTSADDIPDGEGVYRFGHDALVIR